MNGFSEHNVAPPVEEVLKKWWGYDRFRPMQREIIDSVLSGRDTLALMPTGGGKSLTYQVPAMVIEGLTIVITPLIALMKDQVDALRNRGISAVAVHSGMEYKRIELALDNCTYGDVKLLYISPERLATDAFRARLQRMNIGLIAVDEAHCISQWGYDFRPSYLRIAEIRNVAPNAPILALTASATELVSEDIMRHLGFKQQHILRASFARPNLSYSVRCVDDKYAQLQKVVSAVEGSGIVYERTREGCEKLAERLNNDGICASFYHAGLPTMERSLRQEEWQRGDVRVMVATNAFGMGIDKADVRFVVHYSMCDSLEAYYQESGRAGRDGRRSYAVLLTEPGESEGIERRFRAEFPPIEDIKSIYERIAAYLQVAIGDAKGVSFNFNIFDFCHRERLYEGKVISALKILEQNGYMTFTDQNDAPAKLMFTCSRELLYKVNAGGEDMDSLLNAILRNYTGIFSNFRTIDELDIAAKAHLTPQRVHELLQVLWRMHIIRYIPSNRSALIYFNCERLPLKSLYISPDSYQRRYELIYERFNNMYGYSRADDKCRSVIIQNYFGDTAAEPCGICDVCLAKRRRAKQSEGLEQAIMAVVAEGDLSIKEVVTAVAGSSEDIIEMVDKMVRDGKFYISESGKLKINK